LINLSSDERADPIKLCSHIEVAYWYYLDLMRPEDHTLPACNLKEFMGTGTGLFAKGIPLLDRYLCMSCLCTLAMKG